MSDLVGKIAKIINPVAFDDKITASAAPERSEKWRVGARNKAREIIAEIRNGADDAMLRAGANTAREQGYAYYTEELSRVENIYVSILDEALR